MEFGICFKGFMESGRMKAVVRQAEEAGRQDDADRLYDQAADVWTQAVRLNPGGYLDIENWLKSSGRSNVDVYF